MQYDFIYLNELQILIQNSRRCNQSKRKNEYQKSSIISKYFCTYLLIVNKTLLYKSDNYDISLPIKCWTIICLPRLC